jgi:hypothetical protein
MSQQVYYIVHDIDGRVVHVAQYLWEAQSFVLHLVGATKAQYFVQGGVCRAGGVRPVVGGFVSIRGEYSSYARGL